MNPIPIQTARQHQTDRPGLPRARPVLPETDARWILAARACLAAHGAAQMDPGARERLADWGRRHGISPIHAAAIIAMGEMAAARGGLDRADAERLATLPEPVPSFSLAGPGRVYDAVIIALALVAGLLFVIRWF
jgi:hypothetical protein